MTSWACSVVSGLKFIFYWVAHLYFLSLLNLFANVWMSSITQNKLRIFPEIPQINSQISDEDSL